MAGFALASLLPFAFTTHVDGSLKETVMRMTRSTKNATTENKTKGNETTAHIQESTESYACQV